MATISFNIPDPALPRIRAGMLALYPNTEQMEDPDWVDPGDGSTAPIIPKYTDNQWLKEKVRRYIVHSVLRGEKMIAAQEAKDAVTSTDDDVT